VSRTVLDVARVNISVIKRGVRNASSWTHNGIRDSVLRELERVGVAHTTARNIGYQVANILGLPKW